jgi:tetratricopeptide (TPR) repeat protein
MLRNVIHSDDDLQVVHRPGSSHFTIVTFGALGHQPEKTPLCGATLIDKLDLDAVGFVARSPNWYPTASVARAASAVRAVLRPAAIGYGFSMGGYAALKHGARLGLTHALSVSPQLTIDPDEVPEDTRYHLRYRPEVHGRMRPEAADLPRFAVVAADPHDRLDVLHFANAPEGVHRIPLPFMGHAAIWMLASSTLMAKVLDRLLAQDLAGLRQTLRAARATSPHWHRWVAFFALARGREPLAERLLRRGLDRRLLRPVQAQFVRARGLEERLRELFRGVDTAPSIEVVTGRLAMLYRTDPRGLLRVGASLMAHGRVVESEPLFRSALALDPRLADAHVFRIQALSHLDRRADALEAARAGAEAVPGEVRVLTLLGHLLAEHQDPGGAELAYRAAMASNPRHGPAWSSLARCLEADGRLSEALEAAERAHSLLPPELAAGVQAMLRRIRDKLGRLAPAPLPPAIG